MAAAANTRQAARSATGSRNAISSTSSGIAAMRERVSKLGRSVSMGRQLTPYRRRGQPGHSGPMKPLILGAIPGLAAGALTGLALFVLPEQFFTDVALGNFYLLPGLIFGVVFALVLIWRCGIAPMPAILFAILAVAANVLAVHAAVQMLVQIEGSDPVEWSKPTLAVVGALSGGLGGGVLALAGVVLVGLRHWYRLPAIGAACGLALPLLLVSEAGFFAFYLIWQGGYGAVLGACMLNTSP